jgi:hypothetical protein
MTALLRRAGKFVYSRNSNVLMHYMPLQDFSLETAQNHSLIVALRTARLEKKTALLESYEISHWRDTLSSRMVAEVACKVAGRVGRLIDFGGYDGIHFEESKYFYKETGTAPGLTMIHTDSEHQRIFSGLHAQQDWPYEIAGVESVSSLEESATLMVNQAAAVRSLSAAEPDSVNLINGFNGRMILAMRVSAGNKSCHRTTVHGRTLLVPALKEIESILRQNDRRWHYRWLPRKDNALFLPEPESADVGLFVAYRSDDVAIAGFKPMANGIEKLTPIFN